MRYTIFPADMKQCETDFMNRTSVPGALLMEHAAMAVCEAVRRYADDRARVLFVCGPGNNGGDGYCAARLWQQGGGKAAVLEVTDRAHGDAKMNRTLCQLCRIPVTQAHEIDPFPDCDVIVDALFGTGLDRAPEGTALYLIREINACGKPVVAVDIPSGLNGLDGSIPSEAVNATETVTFYRPKHGLLMGRGAEVCGRMTVAPILIPESWSDAFGMRVMTPEDVRTLAVKRPVRGHKGTFGKTVILAGSPGMAGAAAFSARAAVKTGSGLTAVLCRQSILPIIQTLCPAAVCVALPEENGVLTGEAADIVQAQLHTADAAVVGCGLGRQDDLLPLLHLFREADCPVVWDADALNLLAGHRELLPLPAHHVITPHPGEAARLLGSDAPYVAGHLLPSMQQLRKLTGANVLLKDARTLMTDGAETAVNPIGTPALGKGGSGDILSGMLGALLAQRSGLKGDMLTLIQLAAYLHADAGVRAAEALGEYCVTPEDVIAHIRFE